MSNPYRFTALHEYPNHSERKYRVTRRADGQDLGIIHRLAEGRVRPEWQIQCENQAFNARTFATQAKAADALDEANRTPAPAAGELHVCLCGYSVAEHDAFVQAAMRAYAASTAADWEGRFAEAVEAYRQAVPAGKFDQGVANMAGYHAKAYARPHAVGEVKMVKVAGETEQHLVTSLVFADDDDFGGDSVWALPKVDGTHGEAVLLAENVADRFAALAEQVAAFEARGWTRAYAWGE